MYGDYIVSNAGPCLQSVPKAPGYHAGHASGSRVYLVTVEFSDGRGYIDST
jgi:ethanolamine utilization protein EutA (predicted chaperonin)